MALKFTQVFDGGNDAPSADGPKALDVWAFTDEGGDFCVAVREPGGEWVNLFVIFADAGELIMFQHRPEEFERLGLAYERVRGLACLKVFGFDPEPGDNS